MNKNKLIIISISTLILTIIFFLVQIFFKPEYPANTILFFFGVAIIAIFLILSGNANWRRNEVAISLAADSGPVENHKSEAESYASSPSAFRVKELQAVAITIETIVKEIETEIKKQSEWNEGVQAAIETIKYYIDSIYGKMGSHDEVINETTANLEKIVLFIDAISDLSATAGTQTDELVSIIKLLNDSMSDLFKSMDNIDKTSKLIKNLISIIEEIAERTNLIAINASIEAAHVREAGKGFNVISAEIRKLSTNTKDQVKEINLLIKDILGKIEESTAKREEAGTNLDTMNASIAKMKTKMDKMLAESTKQKVLNGTIMDEISLLKSNNADLKQDITEGYESSAEVISITNDSIETSQKIYGFSKNLKLEISGLLEKLKSMDSGD